MQVACNTSEVVQKQLVALDTNATEAVKTSLDDLEGGGQGGGSIGGGGGAGSSFLSAPPGGNADSVSCASRQVGWARVGIRYARMAFPHT